MRSEPIICSRENQNKVKEQVLLQCFIVARFLESLTQTFTHRISHMIFLENSCSLYDRQIIPFNIVLWRRFSAQNVQAVHEKNFRKVRQAKQIRSRYMSNGTKNNKTKFFRILHSKLIDWFLYEGNTGIQWVNKETEKKNFVIFHGNNSPFSW